MTDTDKKRSLTYFHNFLVLNVDNDDDIIYVLCKAQSAKANDARSSV